MTVAPAEGPTHLIDPRFVTRIGLIAVYGLVVVGLLVQYARYGLDSPTMMGFGPLFDPAREQNVPTWFSSTLLYSSALALVLVGLRMRRAGDRDAVWWLVLAGVFCLGSLDETATLHELISRLIRRIPDLTVVPLRPWVIVLGPVALVFILVYARFIARQDARVSRPSRWGRRSSSGERSASRSWRPSSGRGAWRRSSSPSR